MQLIVLHNKPFVINVENNSPISLLKQKISNIHQIPPEKQFLQFSGKNLENNLTINDYNIKNNSIIFLNHCIDGGYVQGFPNVGHLIILLSISTIFLFICHFFFSNMMSSFNVLLNPKSCNPIQSGGATDFNFFYKMAYMFYSSLFVIITTIYGYTLFCNSNLSHWLLVITLASFLIMFLVFYFLFQLVKRKDIGIDRVSMIGTIAFTLMNVVLLSLTFIIPAIKKSAYLHWTTYLYPVGVLISTFLFHRYSNYILNFRYILILLLVVSVFIFIPYILAYVYNTSKLCR